MSKKEGDTVGNYLTDIIVCLMPLLNILFIIFIIQDFLKIDKKIQEFLNRKL